MVAFGTRNPMVRPGRSGLCTAWLAAFLCGLAIPAAWGQDGVQAPMHAQEQVGAEAPASAQGRIDAQTPAIMLAQADARAPAPALAEPAAVAFDIPAQPLADALNNWAIQAGSQVFFEQGPVAGLTAPAVSGSLPPKRALTALLAHTNLEYVENADGAFIVRPKATVAAVRRVAPVPRPAADPVEAPAPVVAAPRSALDAEGPWLVRLRGVYFEPRNRSDAFGPPGAPLLVSENGARIDGGWAPELDIETFFTPHWSSELALNAPKTHDLSFHGPGYAGRVGSFKLMPNFLMVKYGLNPEGVFRPYLGAGLNATSFMNASPERLTKTTTGPAAQAGFDMRLSERWSLNADVKWARVRPALSYGGVGIGQMQIDPLLFGIGVGYRFGGSPPPAAAVAATAPVTVTPPPPADSDGDGVPDTLDKCPNTPHGVQVDASGCPLDSDRDGVPDYLDKCPGTPPGVKVDAQGCEVEEVVLRGVNFKTNSADLTPESAQVLDGVVAILAQRPNAKAEIHGYTDSRGPDAYNLKLSDRRAAAVVDYLAAHGVARANLGSRGFGKDNPVASNDTAAGRAQNRRVTVQFSRPVAR